MRRLTTLILPLLLLGCPADAPNPTGDAGVEGAADTGSTPAPDGGLASDTGDVLTDAGVSADAGQEPANDFIGTWRVEPADGDFTHIAFREDNTGLILTSAAPCQPTQGFPYRYEDENLEFIIEGEPLPVDHRWEGGVLILTVDGEELRLTRDEAICHDVPEPVELVGTWNMTSDGELRRAIAFADTGYAFLLQDAETCQMVDITAYELQGQGILTEGDDEPTPFVVADGNILIGEVQLEPTDSTCHERMPTPGPLPEAIIGTYQASVALDGATTVTALRGDNRIVGISDPGDCSEAYSWPVTVFGDYLRYGDAETGMQLVNWQQNGSSVELTAPLSEDVSISTLNRIRTDCHSQP